MASRCSQRCRGAENPQNSRDLDTNKDYDTGGRQSARYVFFFRAGGDETAAPGGLAAHRMGGDLPQGMSGENEAPVASAGGIVLCISHKYLFLYCPCTRTDSPIAPVGVTGLSSPSIVSGSRDLGPAPHSARPRASAITILTTALLTSARWAAARSTLGWLTAAACPGAAAAVASSTQLAADAPQGSPASSCSPSRAWTPWAPPRAGR